jgi:hypothetical protein
MLYSSIKGPLTQSIQGLIKEDIAKIVSTVSYFYWPEPILTLALV